MSGFKLPVWARPSDIADLLRLSIPIAFSRMSAMLMGLTDAVVLGQHAAGELPYVLNAWLPLGIALGFGMGILMGVQVLTSELLGVNRAGDTGRIFRRGLVAALALGVAMSLIVYFSATALFQWMFVDFAPNATEASQRAAPRVAAETADVTRILALGITGFMLTTVFTYYLEALRRPILAAGITYLAVGVNLLFDLALVGGYWGFPQMGAQGVAWATTGSRWALTIVLFAAIIFMTPAFKPSPKGPEDETVRQFSVGTGSAISNVAEWGGFNLTYIIATWISVATNTVYGYSVQMMGLCFMFYLGVASATSVRVAEAFGRKNGEEIRNASRLGVVATVLVGIVLGLLVILFNDTVAGFLVDREEVLDGVVLAPAIASLLFVAALATVFDGVQATASYALRAQEIVWAPSLIHIGSFFVIMLPACYWLGLIAGRGAQGMIEGALIGVVVAGVLQVGFLEWKTARIHRMHAV